MSTLRAVVGLLTRRERWQATLIFAFMLPNALMQVAGIASIMPFIAVLAQPELVQTNTVLIRAHGALGEPEIPTFLAMLAGIALVLLVLANALAAFTTWLILRFSYGRIHSLSHKLMASYLEQDYGFFLLRNPSDLSKNVLNEVNHLVTGFLMPLLQLAANSLVVVAILVMLVIVDPVLALTVGLALGSGYGAVYLFFRGRLRSFGQRRLDANARRFRTAQETFGAIKDLKVTSREGYYLKRYVAASFDFARNQANVQLIAQLPRYALESIAFGIVLLIALYLTVADHTMQGALPMIALYAMAGYRLMPALQKLFDSAATLRSAAPVVERIKGEMARCSQAVPAPGALTSGSAAPANLRLNGRLDLQGIVYRYPGAPSPVLRAIDITVNARTTVAFVGESGAGKSTLVDIILGLLRPAAGTVRVDGTILDASLMPVWRRHIGYVPQAIYLADDTLRRNIALGIPDREIDEEAVIAAAKAAAIHDFIAAELPGGYDTVTGDRGVRLSGGQRQRIGIARALYHNPDLLILDEATSALDGSTEAAVMDAIGRLSGHKTIIMIAHRLTTVSNCDRIYLLSKGRVAASGTWDELLSHPEFRSMASSAEVVDLGRVRAET